jgi:bifunctional enzyme CysN/CysC
MPPAAAPPGAASPAGPLRLLACGSVDDGKSTLIGRLLYDAGLIPRDRLAALALWSARYGGAGGDLDFALLLDGLAAEREQGITIDVAWRSFTTARRRFIVADAPGHEQYTANMATGASRADLALVLIDASRGTLRQTRRHSHIAALMGIRHVVLAVNKMDLVGFDRERFEAIRDEYRHAVAGLGFQSVVAIPLAARFGDNVVQPSARTPWYGGPCLLDYLEMVDVAADAAARPFRMPVQWVTRTADGLRGLAGTLAAGAVRAGETVRAFPSGRPVTVARIVTMDGDLDRAAAGEAVTLVPAEPLDIARGDVLAAADAPVPLADGFEAHLLWFGEQALFPGRSHLFKLATRTVAGSVSRIKHRIDIDSLAPAPAVTLAANDLALVSIALAAPVPVERFCDGATLGGFIVIDRLTEATVGVGMVAALQPCAPARSGDAPGVDKAARAALKGQRPAVVWFTGLSGAGKSTIARLVEQRLHARGRHATVLDGDDLRGGLSRDLGFSEADRVENIRRAAEVARLMTEAGLIVLAAFISPYRSDRAAARERLEPGEFLEVFVDTPLAECRRRDPKGLYRRAEAGQIRNFTSVDAPYEPPEAPDLHLVTTGTTAEALAEQVVAALAARGVLAV